MSSEISCLPYGILKIYSHATFGRSECLILNEMYRVLMVL